MEVGVVVLVGVMVGLFGTRMVVPVMILVLLPIQFPICRLVTVVW